MQGASAHAKLSNLTMHASLSCIVLNKYYESIIYRSIWCIIRISLKSHKTTFLYERYNIWMLLTDIHMYVLLMQILFFSGNYHVTVYMIHSHWKLLLISVLIYFTPRYNKKANL
jgi:hypothetical protein